METKEEYNMNILVIGNGFDLAHDLPTKYEHFLEFAKVYKENKDIFILRQSIKEEWKKANDEDKDYLSFFRNLYEKHKESFEELGGLILDNVWIEYFFTIYESRKNMSKDGWIDFESEISRIIQDLNKKIDFSDLERTPEFTDKFFQKYFNNYSNIKRIKCTPSIIIGKLLNDLNKLTRALEIYLCEYVEKIEIQRKSPDIHKLEIDFILSFNYTHIFSKLYDVSNQSKQEVVNPFDYIHGETNINNTIETNNMVLGIDEYLMDDRKNKDVEFIAFKKFYQRIFKGTGCEYKKWLDIIQKEYLEYIQRQIDANDKKYIPDKLQATLHYHTMQTIKRQSLKKHNLYIFGHSLDVTDKDILRDLILNDNVYTTIFYPNKEELGRKIANLVKVIGQDELIRRTGGSTKTIEFRQQQDMIPICTESKKNRQRKMYSLTFQG